MMRISFSWSGTGLLPEPTNEVTPGVLRTTYQASSDITMLTRMYPGKMRRATFRRWPSLISMTSSVGTRTSKILSDMSINSTRLRRFARTFSS